MLWCKVICSERKWVWIDIVAIDYYSSIQNWSYDGNVVDFQFVDEGVAVDGVVGVRRALVVLENVVVDGTGDVVGVVVDEVVLMVQLQ